VAQSQVPPEGVLEGPEPRSPTGVEEDVGLALMMGDGEASIVGGANPRWEWPLAHRGTSQRRSTSFIIVSRHQPLYIAVGLLCSPLSFVIIEIVRHRRLLLVIGILLYCSHVNGVGTAFN